MENLLKDWKARLERHIAEREGRIDSLRPDLQSEFITLLEGRIRELRRCIEELEEVIR